jgi:hypothetical protein
MSLFSCVSLGLLASLFTNHKLICRVVKTISQMGESNKVYFYVFFSVSQMSKTILENIYHKNSHFEYNKI